MYITGHDVFDVDPAKLSFLWDAFCRHLETGDYHGAADIGKRGLRIFRAHWTREDALLAQTDWPPSIIQSHRDDHERLQCGMVRGLATLNRGVRIPALDVVRFDRDVDIHMVLFDLPLIERLRRGAVRGPRGQP
jgi:hypothetical protein